MAIRKWVAAGFLLAVPAISHAFCGVYVASAGNSVENQGSRVVMMRQDGRITLTLSSDFTGDAADFGLIIPVPASVSQEDIRGVASLAMDHLDQFTAPRLASYTCDQTLFSRRTRSVNFFGCERRGNEDGGLPDTGLDITVESQFTTGVYDITLISAGNGVDLQTWLDNNAYQVPEGAWALLQESIDGGRKFLAAKLRIETPPAGRAWLPPLQITYDGDALFLPIRIGTLSARGVQDVTVYTITDFNEGAVRIDNYPEVTVEDECMWDPDQGEDLNAFYDRTLADSLSGQAGWITEFSADIQGSARCDPCTAPPLDLSDYGWNSLSNAYLTRLHLRYLPDQVTEDVSFSTTGRRGLKQIRYIQYREGLEVLFPVCGIGMITDDPGNCEEPDGRGGCDVPQRELSAAGLAAATVLLRRRIRGKGR